MAQHGTHPGGRVLIIAGSDSGGGAGIQADIKTVTALQGFATTAITALTAQNTLGVFGVHPIPVSFVVQQIELVLDDIGAEAVKTGMLGDPALIEAIADTLAQHAPDVPVVVDPVMMAKGGHPLLDPSAEQALKTTLVPRATVLTPNVPEAEVLSGRTIASLDDMQAAGETLLALGPHAVLMKGGHLPGETVTDLLVTAEGIARFSAPRVDTTATHGTGCTLASALACGLAQGHPLPDAIARARAYVRRAMETAPGFGSGHGPMNHGHTVAPFQE
ncbi:bifunctional hydroxymethylpyrimidine kinase/phosphomethylpyrimidine kinase [Roseospira marina]|uniref:hydroxymethylpyrimidine kinase n=1 Tax=Roseospira marina TaxID=140057 RepID=A0A5M6IC59_9PROT|nr:bifunctional hydroxymethylpyrimidine kinase/phosphomethylpyrimidine kinase [Roseospira marina]KAA5605831.1 bifunctional hydroxymethylpyrimidine kinase/phosphomethylpyrimidine kinase [Roseospira marina]MBB4313650.1 hydroxymethylpyrimidine/phosphomethylpyrimidine kinase [Roseospira marina]MBB5086812.1 hydroxymethylpyrimidine/phosphomethylpyrimidine kinase [Roseospira marina]